MRENRNNPNRYRTYSPDGCGPCLDDMGGGGRGPHTIEVIGTLDPNRHSQMDVMGVGGGVSQCLDTLKEPKKVALSLSEIQTLRGMG